MLNLYTVIEIGKEEVWVDPTQTEVPHCALSSGDGCGCPHPMVVKTGEHSAVSLWWRAEHQKDSGCLSSSLD